TLQGPEEIELPLQTLPLALWSDGSVKWLLLDFVLPSVRQGCAGYHLTPMSNGTNPYGAGIVSVQETSQFVVVTTGEATFHLNRSRLPVDRVLVGNNEVLEPGAADILLTDAKGCHSRPRVERVSVEARGPVRATVKYEAKFTGRVCCRFVVRFCFF